VWSVWSVDKFFRGEWVGGASARYCPRTTRTTRTGRDAEGAELCEFDRPGAGQGDPCGLAGWARSWGSCGSWISSYDGDTH